MLSTMKVPPAQIISTRPELPSGEGEFSSFTSYKRLFILEVLPTIWLVWASEEASWLSRRFHFMKVRHTYCWAHFSSCKAQVSEIYTDVCMSMIKKNLFESPQLKVTSSTSRPVRNLLHSDETSNDEMLMKMSTLWSESFHREGLSSHSHCTTRPTLSAVKELSSRPTRSLVCRQCSVTGRTDLVESASLHFGIHLTPSFSPFRALCRRLISYCPLSNVGKAVFSLGSEIWEMRSRPLSAWKG